MGQVVYTHAMWRVREGREDEFVEAWDRLAQVFSGLARPPTGTGTLIRSATDSTLFYSFGPWRSEDDVQAMREDPGAQSAIDEVRRLCAEATPGLYRLVREVDVRSRA